MTRLRINQATAGLLTLAAAALLSLAPAAPAPKEVKKALYFPTKFGTTWVYQEGDRETTEAVSGFERKGGVTVVTVVTVEPSGTYPWQKVAVSADGLARVELLGHEFDPPVPLLKLPARVGDRWAVKTKFLTETWAGTRAVQAEEEVRVPAGKFTAVKVEWDHTVAGRPQRKTTSWYAPGIGLVKADFGTSTKVLKKFTPGKD